uniref:Putative alpha-glucanase n=1 Tax=uncultured bacterium Ad_091_F22_contig1 TaxID=1489283 RepID=A0A0B4N012_9BACT|nr:putative alpha-glucanase [uncultured bacterium Ad_091_F22_contig1]
MIGNQRRALVGVLQFQFHVALSPGQIHVADGDIGVYHGRRAVGQNQGTIGLRGLGRQAEAKAAVVGFRRVPGQQAAPAVV